VRINPYELHVADPDFYDQLYTGPSQLRDKYEWSARMFGNPLSVLGTVPHEQHRRRRAALNPYFSKQSILRLMPVILSKIRRLCQRFEEFQKSKQPLNIDIAYSALTMDIITEYCFAEPYGCMDDPDFMPQWPKGLMEASETSHLNKQFGWLLPLMKTLPEWIVAKASPNMMALLNYRKVGYFAFENYRVPGWYK
jgi:cytochrome P450